jgi:hypothetical protein
VLGPVVTTVAQCMYVDSYSSAVDAGAAPEPPPGGGLEIAERV